jgi:hypothetical protein
MDFLAPMMLIGALGAAVPIVIHLIGRRRAPVKKFAAMDFLLGTNRRVARRLRLRELLLLLLRVLACLAIPLAIAKPFVSCASGGVAVARGPQAAVLVLDDSFVMGFKVEGETLFERARERAKRVLAELGTEADVAIELASEGAEPAAELTRDHLRLRDALDTAQLSARPAETTLALRRAAALLASSPHPARRVYLFSALAAHGFLRDEPPWGADGPELIVVPIADGALPNLAIVEARAERDPDLGPRGVRVTARIASFGGAAAKDHGITLRIGDKAVARGLFTLAPGETFEKRFSASLPPDVRTADVTVELDPDALPIDDRRHLRVELRREVRVLLVDGDPRTVRYEDELFYLETALRPGDRADSALDVTVTTVDELPRRRLADYDVVWLCNVKPLDPLRVGELARWVETGGGLAVTMGGNVDPDAYNAQMAPLLAQELRTVLQLAEGPKGPDAGRAEKIGRFDVVHPIFMVFSAQAAGLRDASFWRVMLLGPSEGGGADRATLARFGSGAPAIVEARRGEGRLLLFASTIDRDWNDLAIHPGFLPLVQQSARYLARAPVEERDTELVVGRARALPLTPEDQRVEVLGPLGKRAVIEGAKLKGRKDVPFTGVDDPGFYQVMVERGGAQIAEPGFVANLDPRGSDTARVEPSAIAAGPRAASAAPETARRRVELWHGLAAALLLFLLGEAVLTWRG